MFCRQASAIWRAWNISKAFGIHCKSVPFLNFGAVSKEVCSLQPCRKATVSKLLRKLFPQLHMRRLGTRATSRYHCKLSISSASSTAISDSHLFCQTVESNLLRTKRVRHWTVIMRLMAVPMGWYTNFQIQSNMMMVVEKCHEVTIMTRSRHKKRNCMQRATTVTDCWPL